MKMGGVPTEKELEAHQFMEAKGRSDGYLTPRTPKSAGIKSVIPSAPKKVRSPRSAKSPRTKRALTPEEVDYKRVLAKNMMYHKKLKNGQAVSAEEEEAHRVVEANKQNRVASPRNNLSPEQKYQEQVLNMANARFGKKIKNGKEPSPVEIQAHEMVEAKKAGVSSPVASPRRSAVSARKLEPVFNKVHDEAVYNERVILAGNTRVPRNQKNGKQSTIDEIRAHELVEEGKDIKAGRMASPRSARSVGRSMGFF
jgi:hypothetical protein